MCLLVGFHRDGVVNNRAPPNLSIGRPPSPGWHDVKKEKRKEKSKKRKERKKEKEKKKKKGKNKSKTNKPGYRTGGGTQKNFA